MAKPKLMQFNCHTYGNTPITNYQRQKEPQEQRLKERSKPNFQIKNKIRLCDSKIKTQELRTRT
jgi:hypothetical protein